MERPFRNPRKVRTFRSGPYLHRLFQQAERMDEHAKQQITARVKQAREEAGYTQEEMADLLGVRLRTYQNYESRSAPRPPFRFLRQIAELTGRRQDWFLTEEASPDAALEAIVSRLDEIVSRLDRLESRTAPRSRRAS